MAKVNKEALESLLSDLASAGFIGGWQARPLGMYMIEVIGGEVMRPDAKETAMWVQGVMYGAKMQELKAYLDAEQVLDRPALEEMLAILETVNVLQCWRRDDDGDYLVTPQKGPARLVLAKDLRSWLQGALTALGMNAAGGNASTGSPGGSHEMGTARTPASGEAQYIDGVCTRCGKKVEAGWTHMHRRYCSGANE